MNATNLPTPDDLSLPEIMARFSDVDKARAYLEALRWPTGPVCAHCQNNGESGKIWKIEADKEKKIRGGLYQCSACLKQFTVTVGTIFEDSHIPLNKWLIAWYIFATAKKGISALQMQRTLGLGSYRTAWFMMHRIRHVVTNPDFTKPLTSPVEVDETYVGGKHKGGGRGYRDNKTPVVSLVERNGNKRSMVMKKVTAKNVRAAVEAHVEAGGTIHTDEHRSYVGLAKGFNHESVKHKTKQYVKKGKDGSKVMTNTVESSFALIKRAIYGSFHHVSEKHLPRYLAEFDHKWNTRKDTDGKRMVTGLQNVVGKRLKYREPVKA